MIDGLTPLEYIKAILNENDNVNEPHISHMYYSIENKVRIYCKYNVSEELPTQLIRLICDICIEQIKRFIIQNKESETTIVGGTGLIKSKSIGNKRIEYDVSSEAIEASNKATTVYSDSIINDYETLLRPFIKTRKVMWW